MLRAVVFDFDGVLVDSEPVHYRALASFALQWGVMLDYSRYLRELIGFDDRDAIRWLLEAAGRAEEADNPERVAELCAQKQAAFDELASRGVQAMPGAIELLDQAAARWPLAVASGATRQDIDLMLRGLDRASAFQTIVAADDVARSKPAPESYALAVDRLAQLQPAAGITPENCLAIEDTAAGVASARGAGLFVVGVATTGPAERLAGAHVVAESLAKVDADMLERWFTQHCGASDAQGHEGTNP